VVFIQHALHFGELFPVKIVRPAVDREHARRLADAHDLFPREPPVEEARQRREIGDAAHVLLAV
jgi:hypothetical protein